jgi:D-sedoheptulose 7-phosphate isomerase
MNNWILEYIDAQTRAMKSVPVEQVATLVTTLHEAARHDQQVFVCGNGGSAANASHFAVDLGKGASEKLAKRFRVLSLNDNVPWMTALGNDYSYDDIFVRQLENYARAGDLLLVMSVSGNSPNVVKATDWARQHGLQTIALVGAKRGRLAEMAHQVIVVDSEHYGRVEDIHMTICHILCYAFMELADLGGTAVTA